LKTHFPTGLYAIAVILFIATGITAQDSLNVSLISQRYVTGSIICVKAQDDLLYCLRESSRVVPSREGGQIVIYDISNAELPEERGFGFLPLLLPKAMSLDLPHVAVISDSAVCMCNVSDPWDQHLELMFRQEQGINAVSLQFPYLYLVGTDSVLMTYDITDHDQPSLTSEIQLQNQYNQAEIKDSLLVLAGDNIVFFNITNPERPDSISNLFQMTFDFEIIDNYLYVASGEDGLITYRLDESLHPARISQAYISAIDISIRPNENNPIELVASYRNRIEHVNPDVSYVYHDLVRFDITNPENPNIAGSIRPPDYGETFPKIGLGRFNTAAYYSRYPQFLVYDSLGNHKYSHYNIYDDRSIGLSGDNLIVNQEYNYQRLNRLITYNVTDPQNPRLIESRHILQGSNIIGVANGYLYCLERPMLKFYRLRQDTPQNNPGQLEVSVGMLRPSVLTEDYLYLCTYSDNNPRGNLTVVDLTNPAAPSISRSLNFTAPLNSSALDSGNMILYLAMSDSGIKAIDVSYAIGSRELCSFYTNMRFSSLCIKERQLYASANDVWIFELSDPFNLDSIGCIAVDGWAGKMSNEGNLLVVQERIEDQFPFDTASVIQRFYDVSDPNHPAETGFYQGYWGYSDLKLKGQYLFASSSTQIGVFDISRALSALLPPAALNPSTFSLSAFPNPFNSTTTISFSLSSSSSLRIYDISGRLVADLSSAVTPTAGVHSLIWNADGLPGGIYLIRLDTGSQSRTIKTLLMK